MKSQNPSNPSAPARPVQGHYVHIGSAYAAGGAFTRVGTDVPIDVPIPTVASVELPRVGGFSTIKIPKWSLDCSKVKFSPMAKAVLTKLRQTKLMDVASATATCRALPEAPGEPFRSFVTVEAKGVRVDGGFSLKSGVLNLKSEHSRGDRYPKITFGPTSLTGLKLGKLSVTVEFDLETFSRFPTLDTLEPALFRGDKSINARVAKSFLRRKDGTLHRNVEGYVIGSIVKSITGVPKEWIEEDGYTISWPGFGKVILGEVLIGDNIRRATLIRLKHSDIEILGGLDGGSSWP